MTVLALTVTRAPSLEPEYKTGRVERVEWEGRGSCVALGDGLKNKNKRTNNNEKQNEERIG